MQSKGAYTTGREVVHERMPGQPEPSSRGATTAGVAGPGGRRSPALDLRGAGTVGELSYSAGDVLVVSGLPGSGKSTLIKEAVPDQDAQGQGVRRVDSQDTRDRWERALPALLPYALYRPLVRIAHYASLRRALRSGDSVVVHDCGTLAWVRRWLARDARRRGRALHLALLDVPAQVALEGQALRGRGVSAYAFARHRRAVGRLVAAAEDGRLPAGCTSAVLLDRGAASSLSGIRFG